LSPPTAGPWLGDVACALAPQIHSSRVRITRTQEVAMNMKLPVAVVLSLVGFAGCADRPFVRTDPPAASEGVTVALVGQKCGREAWYENYDVLDLDVVVRVTNTSPLPVEVIPAQMRLLARGNAATPRLSRPKWEDSPVQLAPNATTDVNVHFQRWGNARCDQQMQLSLDHSMEISGRDVAIRPLSFVAARSDV
jgi:hypothetical protein